MWMRIWAFLDWCFFGPASARPGPLGTVLRILRYPYAVLRDLSRGEINLRAMSLVYTTLLSLIPLLAFSFAVLKIFGGHRDLEPIVYEFFRPLGPAASQELTTRVLQFASRVSSGVVGSAGPGAARLDPGRHHQEGRGQLQLPVARRAAAQLCAPRGRVHRAAHHRPGGAGRLRRPAARDRQQLAGAGGGAPAAHAAAARHAAWCSPPTRWSPRSSPCCT